MLITKKSRIFWLKCFSYLLCIFSITADAGSDYSALSQQLNNKETHIQAFEKLKQNTRQDPAALLPLLRFICRDYSTGEDSKRIKAVITFLQQYGLTNKVSESTLESLFAIEKECYSSGIKYYSNIIYVLQEISASQRFSDKILNDFLKITSFQIASDKNKGYNSSSLYFTTLKNQTKYRLLPKKARFLAVQVITDQAKNNRVFSSPIDMLIGQLKYNDKKSEKSLLSMIQPGNIPQLRRSVTDRLVQWYDEQGKLNAFTNKVVTLRAQEKEPVMLKYYHRLLVRLNKNKQTTPEVSERIFKFAAHKKEKYIASVALMEAYLRKSKTAALTELELESVLRVLSDSTHTSHYASNVIISINDAGNMTKKLHESLIELFFSLNRTGSQLHSFKKVIMENIPYRNVEKEFQHSKYPDALLIGVIEYARKQTRVTSALHEFSFLQEVYKHQQLPEQVVEGLYEIYVRQKGISLRKMFTTLFTRYYEETGYMRAGMFASGLNRISSEYQKEIRNTIREYLKNKHGLKEGLYKIFSDKTLNQNTRSFFLRELISEDLDYAVKKVLPADEEELKFQDVIWKLFYRMTYRNSKMVDKKILRDATNSENYEIRHAAWRMMEAHGVSTPFMVKVERKRFRMEFFMNVLFFGGGPLTLFIGSMLFLRNKKGRKEKHIRTKTTRTIIWAITTLVGFVVGGLGLLVSGLSHSGVPYGFIITLLVTIYASYLIIALITRSSIATIPVEQNTEL